MAETELSVVCKNCGAEVSPYVTECPYCGARLRKRAPKLERHGDELQARETRRTRRRRRAAERRARGPRLAFLAAERPYVTLAAILAPAALLVVQRAADLSLSSLGAIQESVGSTDWWQYLAAPYVYDDVGYLFVIALAMALFVPYLERRLGAVPTLILLIACGALGALAAPGIDDAFGDGFTLMAGGNGIALGAVGAWWALHYAAARDDPTEEYDWIPVVVAAAVVLLLPLVEDLANPWAGLVGGLVGLACGFSATLGRR
ncbi:MAG TPA: zinc ribbon domain-containing protein [Solirubrobacterales bacterium]|nr:zinc ribbon domain-containing protein [Solirubrobacterales bacterium]